MSVRLVAIELYRAMKQIEGLEKRLEGLPANSPAREGLEREIKAARTERDRIKKMLNGAKSG